MELQPRDLAILETVGEYGTADTVMLRELHFPGDSTGRACQRRLRILSDEGLLKRVRLIASDGDMQSGSLPTLWFLTDKGAELISNETGVQPRRVTRSEPKPFTLRHRLDTVRARMAIDEAASNAGLPAVSWIMEQDTVGREKAAKGRSPTANRILKNNYYDEQRDRTVTFMPDAAFHLQVPRPSGNGFKNLLGYLEVDRSTEGHLQWQRKLWGIESFMDDAKAWNSHWPQVTDPVVVLFVICKTSERVENLAQTTSQSGVSEKTRFATYPLSAETVLTGDVWQDCHGELKRIIKGG